MKILENLRALVLLAILAILAVSVSYYKFFYEPNQLKSIVQDQSAVIGTLENNNIELATGITVKNESEILKELVVKEGDKIKQALAEKGIKDIVKLTEKVKDIKDDYGSKIDKSVEPEKTALLIKQREKAISKTWIDSLWVNYCKDEPTDIECRSYK